MIAPIMVRNLAPEDYRELLQLWAGYNEFYGRAGANALPARVTHASWSHLLSVEGPVFGLVAQSGDFLVGLAHYLFHPSTTSIELHVICGISTPCPAAASAALPPG